MEVLVSATSSRKKRATSWPSLKPEGGRYRETHTAMTNHYGQLLVLLTIVNEDKPSDAAARYSFVLDSGTLVVTAGLRATGHPDARVEFQGTVPLRMSRASSERNGPVRTYIALDADGLIVDDRSSHTTRRGERGAASTDSVSLELIGSACRNWRN